MNAFETLSVEIMFKVYFSRSLHKLSFDLLSSDGSEETHDVYIR